MIYFDTSYIIKCYLNEEGSAEVRALAESAEGIGCSLHGRVEFWAAVKRNVREGKISIDEAIETFERFKEDEEAGVWTWFGVGTTSVNLTCEKIEEAAETVFLRAADALHLGCAVEQGFSEVFTHDKHMLAAAPSFGITARDVIV